MLQVAPDSILHPLPTCAQFSSNPGDGEVLSPGLTDPAKSHQDDLFLVSGNGVLLFPNPFLFDPFVLQFGRKLGEHIALVVFYLLAHDIGVLPHVLGGNSCLDCVLLHPLQ